jgi:hypothetical protein
VNTTLVARFQAHRWTALGVVFLVSALLAALLGSGPATPLTGTAQGSPMRLSANDPTLPSFRVASFNLLGAGHTEPGGDRAGMASGAQRTEWAITLLDRNGIDVAGFQEFQQEQFDRFFEVVGDSWAVYPGDQLSRAAMHNSIAWRTSEWELVEAESVPITYTLGAIIRMPYVLLRNKESGRLVWFANFHNASNPKGEGDQQKWRDQAKATQVALANTLWESGAPLVLTGDMNEQDTYFCAMTRRAPMRAANGGSWGNSDCTPPADSRIDWIFGSNFVKFSGYVAKRSRLIRKTTDHPLVFADVAVPVRSRY